MFLVNYKKAILSTKLYKHSDDIDARVTTFSQEAIIHAMELGKKFAKNVTKLIKQDVDPGSEHKVQ